MNSAFHMLQWQHRKSDIAISEATVERARAYFYHTDDISLSPAVANVAQVTFPLPAIALNRMSIAPIVNIYAIATNGARDMKGPVSVV